MISPAARWIFEMALYRLCFINPKTDKIDREREIDAADDVDAIHLASTSDHRPLELWCGDRKLQRFTTEFESLRA